MENNGRGPDGRFIEGSPEAGRPKGSANKFTNLKNAFLQVFEDLGGAEGLAKWVKANDRHRAMFYQWITKMLPSSIVGEMDDKGEFKPLQVIITTDGNKPPKHE
jgi:hypothetical protein